MVRAMQAGRASSWCGGRVRGSCLEYPVAPLFARHDGLVPTAAHTETYAAVLQDECG